MTRAHSSAQEGVVIPTAHVANSVDDRHAPVRLSPATTCIEHQAGRPTQRLSFQIKVF